MTLSKFFRLASVTEQCNMLLAKMVVIIYEW